MLPADVIMNIVEALLPLVTVNKLDALVLEDAVVMVKLPCTEESLYDLNP